MGGTATAVPFAFLSHLSPLGGESGENPD